MHISQVSAARLIIYAFLAATSLPDFAQQPPKEPLPIPGSWYQQQECLQGLRPRQRGGAIPPVRERLGEGFPPAHQRIAAHPIRSGGPLRSVQRLHAERLIGFRGHGRA